MPIKVNTGPVQKKSRFPTGGPPLVYRKCTGCKYDFIGKKTDVRCASCRSQKKRAHPSHHSWRLRTPAR
jgi:hypothetical protein